MSTPTIDRRLFLGGTAVAGASLLTRRAARAADDIVVGATVPITGPLAGSGLQYYYALQMAQDDINAAGGINGRKLRIAFEDTQASNSVAVNAFVKLVQQENPPFVFLSSYTVQNLAVASAVTKAEIPTVYAGGAAALTKERNPWMFRIRPPDNLSAEGMAKTLTDRMKVDEVGIIQVQDDYGTGFANYLVDLLGKTNTKVVARETYNAKDNDFSPQLLSLRNKGAKAMALFSYVRDGALLLNQRRSLGIDIPVMGHASFANPTLLDLVTADDVKGAYSIADALLGEDVGPKSADFAKRFQERFKLRADPFGSCYYDAAMILAEAMRKVGPDRVKIRDWFQNLKDYKGVTRTFWTDEKGDTAHNVAIISFKPGTKDLQLVGYYPS